MRFLFISSQIWTKLAHSLEVVLKKKSWKSRIKKACEEAGTYRPFFDSAIDTLATIMENRDKAQEYYERSGSEPVVFYTNKANERNLVKNPILVMVSDLNTQALTYWRDLGLTPAGLKKINDEELKKKRSGMGELLKGLDI